MVRTVCWIVRPIVLVNIVCPETTVVKEVDHATSRDVVYRGKMMVVCVLSVLGGKTNVHGGWQVMVGFGWFQMSGEMNTTPLLSPGGLPPRPLPPKPVLLAMLGSCGVAIVPGPPRSSAHTNRPPRQRLSAKLAFCARVLPSSYDTL